MIERNKLSHAQEGHPMQMGWGGGENKLLLLLLLEMCRERCAGGDKKGDHSSRTLDYA